MPGQESTKDLLLAQALKAEVVDLLAIYADQSTEQGHARVVVSGYHARKKPYWYLRFRFVQNGLHLNLLFWIKDEKSWG